MGQEYSSLNIEERTQLGLLVSQKLSKRQIAAQMGRSASTISRELAVAADANPRLFGGEAAFFRRASWA